jgi:hypothetical protein
MTVYPYRSDVHEVFTEIQFNHAVDDIHTHSHSLSLSLTHTHTTSKQHAHVHVLVADSWNRVPKWPMTDVYSLAPGPSIDISTSDESTVSIFSHSFPCDCSLLTRKFIQNWSKTALVFHSKIQSKLVQNSLLVPVKMHSKLVQNSSCFLRKFFQNWSKTALFRAKFIQNWSKTALFSLVTVSLSLSSLLCPLTVSSYRMKRSDIDCIPRTRAD